ncbi:MAG: hypothetical protein IJZ37_04070, partial [Clostridia bacterium]|nr:hypothetical protein [Clostridia bacterium]
MQGTVPEGVTVVSEDESKRTAFEKHYLLSDGTYYAVSYAEAVHEQDEQGNWVDVDAAPAYDSKDSSYKVKGKQYSADFDTAEGKASLVNKKGQALTWHYELIGASDEKAVMKLAKKNAKAGSGKNASPKGKKVSDQNAFELPQSKGELLFEDAFGAFHAEVRYTVSPQKIKEDVILYEKGEVYALCMVVENCDYKARLEDHAVIFEDNKGNAYFYIDAPLMYDAAGASSTDVQVLLKQTGKTVTVTYTPNKEWLNSNERVYPVTFDPAVTTEDYQANIEDGYILNNGKPCYASANRLYVGKVSGVEAQSVIRVKNLPETGTLPIIQASLYLPTYSAASSYVNGKTLILEQVSYDVQHLSSLQFSTDADSVSQVGSATVATGDTSYTFNVLTSGFLEKKEAGEAVCYRLRFSSVPSGGSLQLGSIEQSTESKRPVLTVCYGYQTPSFLGTQVFLNNLLEYGNGKTILKMTGTTLSMIDYNSSEARASMTLQEGANGGAYIYANYEGNYLDAANGSAGYPVAGSTVSGSSTGDEWVVLQTTSTHYLILLASNPALALTRSSSGITLQTVSEDLEESQLWIITNAGTTMQVDGRNIEDGV